MFYLGNCNITEEHLNKEIKSIFESIKSITRFKYEDIEVLVNKVIGIDSIKNIDNDINFVQIKSNKFRMDVSIIENNPLEFVVLHAFIAFDKKLKENCGIRQEVLLMDFNHKKIEEWRSLYLEWLLFPNENGLSINEFFGLSENAFDLLKKEYPQIFIFDKKIEDLNALETLALFIESKSRLNVINLNKVEFIFRYDLRRELISESCIQKVNVQYNDLRKISIVLKDYGLVEEIGQDLIGWEWITEESRLILKTKNSIIKLNVLAGIISKEQQKK